MRRTSKPARPGPSKIGQEAQRHVRLRIICISPPKPENYGAAFGLQDNSTTKEWVIHAGETQPNGDVQFECECRVRRNPANGKPNFLGPFPQVSLGVRAEHGKYVVAGRQIHRGERVFQAPEVGAAQGPCDQRLGRPSA